MLFYLIRSGLPPRSTLFPYTTLFRSRSYERYGVEEYYVYDPETGELTGFRREGDELREIPEMRGWDSPRLGVHFDLEGTNLRLTGPDGRLFASYQELARQCDELARDR